MPYKQYKVSHDEAYIIAAALDSFWPRDLFNSIEKSKATQYMNAIHELRNRMDEQAIDGRSGRRSEVSLSAALNRLHLKFMNERWS